MTSDTPPERPNALAQGWQHFRHWRRARPFWGGLFLILSGLEILLSANQDLGNLQFHIGTTGYLAYLIPAVLLLCGLLVWFTPGQRLFYGIIGVLTALFSAISVNLGGFLIGMFLGMIGGALAGAWVPVTPAPGGEPPRPVVDLDSPARDDADTAPDTPVDQLPSGPLSDQLPTATTSPLARPDDPGDAPPGPRHAAWRNNPGGTALILVALTLASAGVVTLRDATPALAAPCTTKPAKAPTTRPAPAAVSTPGPSATTPAVAASPVNPSPSPAGSSPAGPSPAPPASSPAGSPPATPRPKPTATCPPGGTAAPRAAQLAPAPGQPFVAGPGTLMTATLEMHGLSFDGVVDLPLKGGGTITVLQFSMASARQTPFELDSPATAGHQAIFTASTLTISGNVKFYCTKFSGYLLDLIPLTFTPALPPPLVLPTMVFNRANISLVFVRADLLTSTAFSVTTG